MRYKRTNLYHKAVEAINQLLRIFFLLCYVLLDFIVYKNEVLFVYDILFESIIFNLNFM